MLLLSSTLQVCILLLFLSFANNEVFNRYGPKPSAQFNGASNAHGSTQVIHIVENPTTESPEINKLEYTVSVEVTTSKTYHTTTTQTKDITITSGQIGNALPQRNDKPPKEKLLRTQFQTAKPRSLHEHEPNYDLEFWPPNKDSHTEKTPQTALPSSIPETTFAWFNKKTTKQPENYSVTTTAFLFKPSSNPRLMTNSPNKMQSTTTQRPLTFFSTNVGATQPHSVFRTVLVGSTKKDVESTPATAVVPNQTTESETTSGTLDEFHTLVTSTSMDGEKGLSNIPTLTQDSFTTSSSVEAGLKEEETLADVEEDSDLTGKESGTVKAPNIITLLKPTVLGTSTTESEDWLPEMTQESALPDCNAEYSDFCNSSGLWAPTYPSDNNNNDTITTNQSQTPTLFPSPPMLVPLYTDWNRAMATWGLAWEAHVYGLGTVFCLISLASSFNLLFLPLCCPSGCGYFALVSLFLLAAGGTRAFALLYDAYGYQDRMTSPKALLLLYEAPFPCMTAAFGLVFLLLSMRSRMQLSYSAFQRPCFLACLVLLHFAASFGLVLVLRVDQQGTPLCLFLSLISRGAFVILATFLSIAYFVFFCYVRADSKHIYHLNNTSPTPAERYNRCPFAESQDWDRAAAAVFLAAIFSLACAALQLYAMLHAVGLAGGPELFQPWPWWAFQLSCRLCEAIVCLTLALVVSQPVYCSDHLPLPGSCWMELLAAKSPIIPGSYQWTLTQQEKMAICDTVGHGETECLPLYTLVDDRIGSLNGLDLLYHSNRALAHQDLDLQLPDTLLNIGALSVGSSCPSDSTADLQPPSPINLSRSIDEALFSEALFPISLFSPTRPFTSSDHSLDSRDKSSASVQTLTDIHPPDPGLYRTSSCLEMLPKAPMPALTQQDTSPLGFPPSPSLSTTSSCCSYHKHCRGSSCSCSIYRPSVAGSSLLLCPSPEGQNTALSTTSASSGSTDTTDAQKASQYSHSKTQSSQEIQDPPPELGKSMQKNIINMCKKEDALSIHSETIDL